MFLPWAHIAELEVQCDGDRWKSPWIGLQHHLAQHLTQHLATISRCLEILNFMLSLFLSVENLPIRLEALHWGLRSLLFFRLRVGSRNSWSRPDNFAVPSAIGKINTSPFCGVHTSFALILQGWISDASICPSSSRSATRISHFQLPHRLAHVRGIFPIALSYQIGGALTCLLKKIGLYSTIAPTGITGPLNFSPNRLS